MTQGMSQFQQGQYDIAFQSWQRALELYQALGDRKPQAWVLENLGTAAFELKQAESARDYFVQGL
jgi:tetratricopeptide (TPR) repeat protein